MLNEGFDEPRVEGIILCRPTTSPVLFVQTVGRGLRPSLPEKAICTLLDFTGATTRHDLVNVNRALGVSLRDGETASQAFIREEIEAANATATAEERARLIAEQVDLFQSGHAQWASNGDVPRSG